MGSEVLIIGGGVIGLSIAREMHKNGVNRITLVEKGVCGEEASWAAAGMLSPQVETDAPGAFFDLCCASRDLYPAFAAELLDETGVDIELDRTGTLRLALSQGDEIEFSEQCKWQQKAGLSVERLSKEDTLGAEPLVSPLVRGALFFPNDWQVESRKLLAALKFYAEKNGIEILERTEVEKLVIENNRVAGARTKNRVVNADTTVLATGAWTSLIKLGDSEMPVKVEPVRGQIIAFQAETRAFRHVLSSRNGYLVPRRDGRILAGSTSEKVGFDKSTTDSAGLSIKEMACAITPVIAELEIVDRWSGLRPHVSDGLPVFGPISGLGDLFFATGHYRNGILLAPLTAKLTIESRVNGTESDYLKAFNAERFSYRGVGIGGHH